MIRLFLPIALSAALPAMAQNVNHAALRERALTVLEAEFDGFRSATTELTETARDYCGGSVDKAAFTAAFETAWLAWAPLDTFQFGPVEQNGAALSINFWPDKKNFTGRALRNLAKHPPKAQADPAVIAAGSAAAQGFPAIEMLLVNDAPDCPAVIGISGNLQRLAGEIYDGWFAPDGWADLARAAGPDNPVYLNDAEFTKALFTAIDFGLFKIQEQRLGRPFGKDDRAFPTRAEAWRSGLSAAIIKAQLGGIETMIRDGFAVPGVDAVTTTLDQVQARLDGLDLPLDQAVADPAGRWQVDGLRNKLAYLIYQTDNVIGPALGVDSGFSPADGD